MSIDRRTFALRSAAAVTAAGLGGLTHLTNARLLHFHERRARAVAWDLETLLALAGVPGLQQASAGSNAKKVEPFFGIADAERGATVNAATAFESASLSKPTVAYLTLIMVDRGRIELDAPIRDYLAESPVPDDPRGDRITVRHVLSHSSGLQNWRFNKDDKLELAFDPGTKFGYSGEGFVLLQRVLEQRTNTAFVRLMREELFEPLGMTRSSFLWSAHLDANIASPHSSRGVRQNSFGQARGRQIVEYAEKRNPPVAPESLRYPELVDAMQTIAPNQPPFPNFFVPNAAASLLTTAEDYARFVTLLLDDRAAPPAVRLRPATREAMRTGQTRLAPGLAWGLGIGLEERETGVLLWHWGDNGGYKNFVIADPAGKRGRVIFSNGSGGLKVAERLLRDEYGDLRSFVWV